VTMTKSSCPSADVAVRSTDLGRAYGECSLWRADALREIADLRPEIVVLANASNLGGPLVADPSRFGVLWQEALERSIGHVQTSGTQAVVLQDTPAWSVAPNRALSASLHEVAAVTRPWRELVDPRAREAERAAARSTGSLLVDPLGWLCTTGCSPVLWNIVVYRDANHLTQPMATALSPRLADALQPLLAPAEPLDGSR
jgi:hypothetical protein